MSPYDFLSLTYDLKSRCTTVLIRQSNHPRRQEMENIDEYDNRMEACRSHWAHPFIMPVVLLQVQFSRTEEAVAENNNNVMVLQAEVGSIAGFEAFEVENDKRSKQSRRFSFGKDTADQLPRLGPMDMTNIMKNAHEVLKDSVKLLDTVRWMERAVEMLIQAGDELSERMGNGTANSNFVGLGFPPGGDEGIHARRRSICEGPSHDYRGDPLVGHWHEIRQYLGGLRRLCISLEGDRKVSETQCRAQIDIVSQLYIKPNGSWPY
jgi:hypothetical protein